MSWVVSFAGVVVAGAALRDVFHTLFHPTGSGTLSSLVLRGSWRGYRRLAPGRLTLAGPTAFVCIVVLWALLLVTGFALLFQPHLGTSFSYSSAAVRGAGPGFGDALYFSGFTLGTLGYGDIVPTTAALRLLAVLEGLLGLALLTAAVSWLLSIYNALQRRNRLAAAAAALARGGRPSDDLLESLALEVAGVRADLVQHSAAYFFQPQERELALPVSLPTLYEVSGRESEAASILRASLDGLARTLRDQFVAATSTDAPAVFAAYAADHQVGDHAVAEQRRA